jgi:hypothetical protein
VRRHSRPAQLIPFDGIWTIIIDDRLAVLEATIAIAHELAHLWLHHDPLFERWETEVFRNGNSPLEEREADTFAELLVRGPGERSKTSASIQVADRPHAPAPPASAPRVYERHLAKQAATGRWLARGRTFSDSPSEDDRRLTPDPSGRHLRYEDPSGRFWRIDDYRKVDGRWRRVRDYMRETVEVRVFTNSAGLRKAYRFADRHEQRVRLVRHLDRQLAVAAPLPRAIRASTSRPVEMR